MSIGTYILVYNYIYVTTHMAQLLNDTSIIYRERMYSSYYSYIYWPKDQTSANTIRGTRAARKDDRERSFGAAQVVGGSLWYSSATVLR